MSAPSDEIELLVRVLFRLGTADTDEQLENAVLKFLTPVLLKITSPHESVRCKVMEILTHVNKRLKSRPQVQLPVEHLLTQYQTTDSSFLHNFSIIYITMGFPRLSIEKQTELTPQLLHCLEGKPESHQDKLLMLVIPLLGQIKVSEVPGKKATLLGLADKPITKKQFLNLLIDVFLLPYGVTPDGDIPSGMSPYSFKRVIANNWKAEELEQLKKGIVRFISNDVFPDADVLVLMVLASADTRFSVATPAIAELNKICTSLDWSDPSLSAPLYILFSGNGSKVPDRKTTACSARVRQKLLQYLLKSRGRGINTAKGIQVIFESLFGDVTNQKCKVLSLKFAENVIKDGPRDLITKLSKVLLTGISKLIGTSSNESYDVQNAAYGAVAQLARVCPDIFNVDLQIVVSYFTHLAEAPPELHTSIREALISIAPAFKWSDATENVNQNLLLALLEEHSESKSTIVQNVASLYLTTCFQEWYVPARYLLLVVAGGKSSLRESVTSYLYGVSKKDHINYLFVSSIDFDESIQDNHINNLSTEQRRVVLPNFKEMVRYTYELCQKRCANPKQRHTFKRVVMGYDYETYIEILDYLRMCLWYSAGARSAPGDVKHKPLLAKYLEANYKDFSDNEICQYLELIKRLLMAKKGSTELLCLYDLLDVSPKLLSPKCSDLMEIFDATLKDVSEVTRNLISQSYGILIAYGLDEAGFCSIIKDLLSMTQRTLEHKHGCILTISHAFNRQYQFGRGSNASELKSAVELLGKLLKDNQHLLVIAAIKGLSLMGAVTKLPIENGGLEEKLDAMEVDDSEPRLTKTNLHLLIVNLLKSAHSRAKVKEEAAYCLGSLAIGDGKFFANANLKIFVSIVKLSKDTTLNIAIARAIVNTVLGFEPLSTIQDISENPFCNDSQLEWFINELIKVVPEPHPCSRNAVSLWLLALVKNCSKRQPVYSRKQLLQYAFTELLSDDSDFVQDVASRGLGLVFSLSDSNSQSDLANSLLDQLIGGKRQVNQVTEESKIFEDGVLGKTPTGGNITTYKELCSLASDMNQPEMIYQFMQLANHNAAWNSKLGAAFGLKSISFQAKEKMQPYLGKIVPRLFRYKYDPTPKIQNSMISIWDSIVTDSKDIVEQYYWEILDELLTNLTFNEWRVRIACCLALRDLIKRSAGLKLRFDDRKSTEYPVEAIDKPGTSRMDTSEAIGIAEPELAKLWTQLFRVMDDVHEGTRLAAEGTAKTLSKICIVAASKNNGKSGQAVASSVLPILLETGVIHTVAEIRRLSMATLSELIDSSGDLITPHLPTLVPCLLRATGELEAPKLSYLSTRLGAESDAQEAVDTIRAEAAKQHHSMETLSKCIRYIDYVALEKMTPEVIDLMNNSVSLGTKVGCAHFICLITVRFGNEMTPLASKYLGAAFSGLQDRTATVRKYNASAIGHLIGVAKDQSVVRLFAKLTDFYLGNQMNRGIPQTVFAINKRHSEILKDYSSNVLPLVFFAMHEESNEENVGAIEMWKDLWTEISMGEAGIRLNLPTITEILEKTLAESSWLMKAQSANAINTVANKLGTSLGDDERCKFLVMLLNNVAGRTFQGKERILQALASLCNGLKKDESNLHKRVVEAVMREARKEEPIYRTHALKALGNVLEQLKEDCFEEVYNMVWYLLDKKDLASATGEEEEKNLSSDERNKRAATFINLKETVCVTLGKAWPETPETQKKYQMMFVERVVVCLRNNTRPVQLSLLVALGKFLDRLNLFDEEMSVAAVEKKAKVDVDDSLQIICKDVLAAVVYVSGIPHTGLKKEALNIVLILIKKLSVKNCLPELHKVKQIFEDNLAVLQKDTAPEVKCRIKDIEEKLKVVF